MLELSRQRLRSMYEAELARIHKKNEQIRIMIEAVSQDLLKRHQAEVERIEAFKARIQRILKIVGDDLVKRVRTREHQIIVHQQAERILKLVR